MSDRLGASDMDKSWLVNSFNRLECRLSPGWSSITEGVPGCWGRRQTAKKRVALERFQVSRSERIMDCA